MKKVHRIFITSFVVWLVISTVVYFGEMHGTTCNNSMAIMRYWFAYGSFGLPELFPYAMITAPLEGYKTLYDSYCAGTYGFSVIGYTYYLLAPFLLVWGGYCLFAWARVGGKE